MRKLINLVVATLMLLSGLWMITPAHAQSDPIVLVIDLEGPVSPVMLSFLERAITEADVRNAEALIVRLNTPGGEVQMTKSMIQAIIASDVPVVVYVWPAGGFAASAGTFITLAGHAAAMAPNTTIGAASPVSQSGEEIDDTARAKVENILLADVRALAERRGEDAVEWAESTISEANAANAEEALELGIIDFIADDTADLLEKLDGFEVELQGDTVELETAQAQLVPLDQTTLELLLGFIVNPAVALFLISIGGLAITYEFINPVAISAA